MKKIVLTIVLLFPFNVFAFGSHAKSAILMDMDSGRILYGKNTDYTQSVASISKIMTAICVIENTDIEKEVMVGDEINQAYGSGIYVKNGERLKIKDLLYGLMLRSGNDAALVLAVNTSKSVQKFVDLMNKTAKKIGMKNTTFNNPSGLDERDDGNISSSFDMAILMSYAMKNKSFRKITGTKSYFLKTDMNTYRWDNKNKLLHSYKYCTGGKTGYTKKAKRTLVTSASKDNLNLTVITINDGDDWNDHVSLYEEAFNNYHNYILFKKGWLNIPGENYYGNNLLIKNNVSYPLNDEEVKILKIKYELNKKRKYKNGDEVGMVRVFLGSENVVNEKIYVGVRK